MAAGTLRMRSCSPGSFHGEYVLPVPLHIWLMPGGERKPGHGAERVLRWLPPGTHDWRRVVRPAEIANPLRDAGMSTHAVTGVSFAPMSGGWKLSDDTAVNYMLFATKAG